MKTTALALIAATALAADESRDLTIRKAKKLREPLVQDKNCSRLCLFENDNNSWCISTTPPIFLVGWEWYHEFGTLDENTTETLKPDDIDPVNYYRWSLEPYFELQTYLQSLYDVERFYYNEFTFSLSKFHYNTFLSLILNGNWQYCLGAGIETEAIDLAITMSMKFMDCYKTIFKDLCDFTTTWRGYEAKWFEECDQSVDANIEMWEKNIKKETTNTPSKGTVYPMSREYCKALPLIGSDTYDAGHRSDSPLEKYAKLSYKAAGNYIMDNYGSYLRW